MTEQPEVRLPAAPVPVPAEGASRHPDALVRLQAEWAAANDQTRARFLKWAGFGG